MGSQHQSLLDPLSIDLEKSVGADATNGMTSLVRLHGLLHRFLDLATTTAFVHIDEVDNDQSTQISQTKMTTYLASCFEVGIESGFFLTRCTGRAARVDIDRGQGLCAVYDDRATTRSR